MYAETCLGVLQLTDICAAATAANSHIFRPVGIVFGSDDLCASLGASRTESSLEILYARQRVVMVAKAYALQAIDMVHIDYKDMAGLRTNCEAGARMGYTGKQVIHPGQLDIVQAAFLPSAERIRWATGLVEAFHQHQRAGTGAFVYENQMIDMPTMRQAENILEIMKNKKS